MVSCCERVIIPTTEEVVHRSRIIPVSPANWDDDADDIVVPAVVKKLDAQSSSKVEPSSSPRNNNKLSSLPLDATNNSGILRIDKSMHFAKLLVMNCYDVNHRAMAIAILQLLLNVKYLQLIIHRLIRPFTIISAHHNIISI